MPVRHYLYVLTSFRFTCSVLKFCNKFLLAVCCVAWFYRPVLTSCLCSIYQRMASEKNVEENVCEFVIYKYVCQRFTVTSLMLKFEKLKEFTCSYFN
jgi:hypothetical protein